MVTGDVRVDLDARTVEVDGKPVTLTQKEFELVEALLERPGAAVSRQQLMDRIWGDAFVAVSRTLDVHMTGLRAKLNRPGLIATIRGYGYRWGSWCRSSRRRLLISLTVFAAVAVFGFAIPLALTLATNRTQQFVLARSGDAERFASLADAEATTGRPGALAAELALPGGVRERRGGGHPRRSVAQRRRRGHRPRWCARSTRPGGACPRAVRAAHPVEFTDVADRAAGRGTGRR